MATRSDQPEDVGIRFERRVKALGPSRDGLRARSKTFYGDQHVHAEGDNEGETDEETDAEGAGVGEAGGSTSTPSKGVDCLHVAGKTVWQSPSHDDETTTSTTPDATLPFVFNETDVLTAYEMVGPLYPP